MARTLRVALVVLLVGAATAVAAEITRAPEIHGDTSVGKLLQATAGEWTPADAAPAYVWVRCSSSATSDCTPIDGACSRRHVVLPADAGQQLRIRLTVADGRGQTASVLSDATGLVPPYNIPAPGDPGVNPEPDTCTKVTPTGPGSGSFESGTQPEPVTPAPQLHSRRLINPFPLVRISGRFHKRFTRVTRVAVRAPRGVRIGLRCRGRGCAARRRAIAVRLVRVRSLQRRYRPGAVLELRITKADRVGKYVRMRVRAGKAPVRIDRCLLPGTRRPVRCPAG